MRSVVVGGLVALGVCCVPATAGAGGSGPAVATAETVVVAGTSFPTASTRLTYFGCTTLEAPGAARPDTHVVRDDAAPAGRRVLGLGTSEPGTAAGPVSRVESVATATSSLSVDAAAGSQGVAYVWYVSDELEAGQVWVGRAELTAGGGWQQVDALGADYSWTRLEAESGDVLDQGGAASLADFTAEHGDGPGYLLSGFGCDARPFRLDRVTVGSGDDVTTYDLEGWAASTAISADRLRLLPGEEVRITGTSTDQWGRQLGRALVLEARPQGDAVFRPVTEPVAAGPDGSVQVSVAPDVTTDYRWTFAETGYADAHWSAPVTVVVAAAAEAPAPAPSDIEPAPASPSPEPSSTAGKSSRPERSATAEPTPAPASTTDGSTPAPEPAVSSETTAEAEPDPEAATGSASDG